MHINRITIYGDTVISASFCCVGVSGTGSGSGNGQVYTVTITAIPNTTTYSVGDLVTLLCMVNPPISSDVTYLWQCNSCFADGMTDMAITRVLSEMDNAMINCSATINKEALTTVVPFNLVTQGRVVSFWPNKIILCNMYMYTIICNHWLTNVNL